MFNQVSRSLFGIPTERHSRCEITFLWDDTLYSSLSGYKVPSIQILLINYSFNKY